MIKCREWVEILADVNNEEFREILQREIGDDCEDLGATEDYHQWIVTTVSPEIIAMILATKPIPPHWAGLILRLRYWSLTDTQIQSLINAIATDAKWSFYTLRDCVHRLAPDQIQQLIDRVITNAGRAMNTLCYCDPLFTPDQIKQLVAAIAANAFWSRRTRRYHSEWLTDTQIKQLVLLAGRD